MLLKKKNKLFRLSDQLRTLLIYIKAYLFSFIFIIFIRPFLTKSRKSTAKNVLIVQTDKLGDIILSLIFLHNLAEIERECNKYLLIDEKYVSGIFVEGFQFKIIPINKAKYRLNLFYRIRLLNHLRQLELKFALNISQGRGIINDEITINCNTQSAACTSSTSYYLPKVLLRQYNRHYNFILESTSVNEFTRLKEFYISLYKVDYRDESGTQDLLAIQKPPIKFDNDYILIAPASSDLIRNWSQANFKSLSTKLSEKLPVYLLGTEGQKEYLRYISDGLPNVINLAGQLSLTECFFAIKNSALFVGLDSGFTHVAETFNIPYVAIIGGGKFGRFFPYPDSRKGRCMFHELPCFNCNWQCIYHQAYCLSLISVESVFSNCLTAMESI